MRHFFIMLVVYLVASSSAFAIPLDLYTGPKTGTYFAVGQDVAMIAQNEGLELKVIDSEGSVDNIKRLQQANGPALAILQSDVVGFLTRSSNPVLPKLMSNLRVVSPFYMEEIHVLARQEIQEFKDLQGKKVAVGEDGSGHLLTALNLFAIEQIVPSDVRKISQEEGVVEVLRGNLDAVVLVGGKPIRIFKNMEDLSNPENKKFRLLLDTVHFLPMNNPKFYEEYAPAEIKAEDYEFVKTTMPTIAVQSMLVSLDTQSGSIKQRCDAVRSLTRLLQEHVVDLKQSGHPKWREVNFGKTMPGWQKDNCAWSKKQ